MKWLTWLLEVFSIRKPVVGELWCYTSDINDPWFDVKNCVIIADIKDGYVRFQYNNGAYGTRRINDFIITHSFHSIN